MPQAIIPLIAAGVSAAGTAYAATQRSGGSLNFGAQDTTEDVLKALTKNLPDYTKVLNEQVLPTEQARVSAQRAIAPQIYTGLIQDYSTYGPELNKIAQDIQAQNQIGAIGADVAALQGPGRTAVSEAQKLLEATDPQYFANRGLVGDKMAEVLKASSATVSPTERAELMRSIGRESTQGPESALSTIENAQQFGSLATQKANNLGNIVAQAASALPALRSGADFYGIATGKAGLGYNPGQALFSQNQPKITNTAYSNSSDLLSQIGQYGGNQQKYRAMQPDFLQNLMSNLGGITDIYSKFQNLT